MADSMIHSNLKNRQSHGANQHPENVSKVDDGVLDAARRGGAQAVTKADKEQAQGLLNQKNEKAAAIVMDPKLSVEQKAEQLQKLRDDLQVANQTANRKNFDGGDLLNAVRDGCNMNRGKHEYDKMDINDRIKVFRDLLALRERAPLNNNGKHGQIDQVIKNEANDLEHKLEPAVGNILVSNKDYATKKAELLNARQAIEEIRCLGKDRGYDRGNFLNVMKEQFDKLKESGQLQPFEST